jgi:trk system potassium uptake protein TrkA
MGARQVIARVQNPEYLTKEQREKWSELGIDSVICPTQLAASEIIRLIKQSTVTDLFDFEGGKLTLIGVTLDDASPLVNMSVREISDEHGGLYFKPIAILRGDSTILPRDHTIIRRADHIYFLTQKEKISEVFQIVGKHPKKVKNIMVIGGDEVGLKTAQLLEKENFHVSIVEKNKEQCKTLAGTLNKSLIINGDPSNVDLLREEGLTRMDAFIALTPNAETNIITSLVAEEAGVYKTIALVDNVEYTHISQNIGIDTIINKKLIAANNIFRFVRKGKIEAIASLHGVDAEIIEFVVHKENRLTKNPIKDLHFPEKAVIAGIIRGEESIFPTGDFQLQKEDKVIVFTQHEVVSRVEKLFR